MEETEYKEIIKELQNVNKFFDRKGKSINLLEYSIRMEDPLYKSVKQEYVGKYWVSTVWLGYNMSLYKDGPIQIFETMIFPQQGSNEDRINDPFYDWVKRYSTEEEAIEGHQRAVGIVNGTIPMDTDE